MPSKHSKNVDTYVSEHVHAADQKRRLAIPLHARLQHHSWLQGYAQRRNIHAQQTALL